MNRMILPSRPRLPAQLVAFASIAFALLAGRASQAQRIGMDDPSWHLESSSDGIMLYSGSVPETRVVPLKAVMTIPGTIEEVSVVLEDIARRGEWISNFSQSVLLERANDYDQIEYLRVNLPWPAQNRTAVIRATITVRDDLKRATIAAESVESHLADKLPELVRAQVHASTFQMTQVQDHVEVVALVFVDPVGSIPKWMVNYFSRRAARSTLAALRRQVARKLYPPSQITAMRRRIEAYRAFRERGATSPSLQRSD
jgi:hypothetical protein